MSNKNQSFLSLLQKIELLTFQKIDFIFMEWIHIKIRHLRIRINEHSRLHSKKI